MKHHEVEALSGQGAAHASARRRRRRRFAAVAAFVLGVAAAAVVWVNESAETSHHRARAVALAPALALAGRRSSVSDTATGGSGPAPTAAQLATVRRLAALGLPLRCGGRSKRVLALTFDDGPGVYTHLAVKKLREFHAQATFFLVGKEIRVWPRQIALEQQVAAFGDHTMTHPFLPALARAAMSVEIARAKGLIERTTGEPVVLFRPPYEGRTPAIDREVRRLGMLEVLWSVDSQDSLRADYSGIERNVTAGLRPGSIILMHENRGQTIRALPVILTALKRRHLRAVTLPELLAEDPPSMAQLRAGGGCGVSPAVGNGS